MFKCYIVRGKYNYMCSNMEKFFILKVHFKPSLGIGDKIVTYFG